MAEKTFIYYDNGEVELVEKDRNGNIVKYITHWNSKTELKESLGDI